MKRELFQNVKVQPYTSDEAVEKEQFSSAVLGAKIGTAGTLTVTVTHSDDDTEYSPVTDKLVFTEKPTENGAVTTVALEKDDIINFDIDLLPLKKYVKFTVLGDAAAGTALALVLGDSSVQPV